MLKSKVQAFFEQATWVLGAALLYTDLSVSDSVNPLVSTSEPQSNGPSYSNTVIGTLAVDG